MKFSSELKAKIEKRIQDLTNRSNLEVSNLRQLVINTNALPLLLETGEFLAINPKGEVIFVSWDGKVQPRLIVDSRVRNIGIFQGSLKYPELKLLIPIRPSEALVCPYCKGTGIEPLAEELNIDNIICYCGGLGWIPSE